jgi:hypothetical protein
VIHIEIEKGLVEDTLGSLRISPDNRRIRVGMTIEEFLPKYVVDATLWQEWLLVEFAPKPETRLIWPESDEIFPRHDSEYSPNFERACELRKQFIAALRVKLDDGIWEVTGRTGDAASRQLLERVDWGRLSISLSNNSIGNYKHIEIKHSEAVGHDEILKRFIENVCKATNPGEKLTKTLIRELAAALCRDDFQLKAFNRAWDDAKIDPRWRRAGPR